MTNYETLLNQESSTTSANPFTTGRPKPSGIYESSSRRKGTTHFPTLELVLASLSYTKPVTLALKFSCERVPLLNKKEPLNSVPTEQRH